MIVYEVWDKIKCWNVNECDGWCYVMWFIGWMGGIVRLIRWEEKEVRQIFY